MLSFTLLVWISFLALITLIVVLDLGIFHRESHVVTLPEALGWTTVWVTVALLFNIGVYYLYEFNPEGWDMDTTQLSGREAALQYFTGYLVEKSLSIDNIFVIAMVFAHFRVPLAEQHRVLFWGILSAVFLRGAMILGGVAVIERFEWVVYFFGALLLYSAAKMLVIRHDNLEPEDNLVIKLVRRFYPVTPEFHGRQFLVRINGVRHATPLLLALVLVEISDVTFAVDSIPAIFAITRDPFIVFTSNVFAILGLRSLYFVLAGLMEKFRYLKMSLVFLLAFIGVKMLLVNHYHIPNEVSLAIIGGILAVGILASTQIARDTAVLISPLSNELERILEYSYSQGRTAVVLVLFSSLSLVVASVILLPLPWPLLLASGTLLMTTEIAWSWQWLKRLQAARSRIDRQEY